MTYMKEVMYVIRGNGMKKLYLVLAFTVALLLGAAAVHADGPMPVPQCDPVGNCSPH